MKKFIFFLYSLLFSSIVYANYKAFVGATLINTNGDKPLKDAIVLVKDSIIVSVGDKIQGKIPEGTEIINVKGKYIIPGLFDTHIHFFQSGGLYTRPDGLDLRHRRPYEEVELKWIRDNIDDMFRRYMRCGVTSIIDLGGPWWNFDIREKSKKSKFYPNTYCTGPLIASYQPPQLNVADPPIIKVNTIDEALDLVNREAKKGADFIKVWYVVSKTDAIGLEEFFPILEAIVKESHKLGLKVWVHATELKTAKKALLAGADVLVHMIVDEKVDDEFINLAKKTKVIVIPTMWVFSSYAAVYSKQLDLLTIEHLFGNPEVISSLYDMYELAYEELGERQKKLQIEKKPIRPSEILLYNTKTLFDNGIILAAGTDAGNVGVVHGASIFHEFLYMKEAGLTEMDILKSATINASTLLDLNSKYGTVEKNKIADFIVLNSNPLDNILNISDIYKVVRNGNVLSPEEIITVDSKALAQIQLNAYNEKDIEAFLSVYAADVEVYNFPNELLFKGIDEMRKVYTSFFNSAPNLHCKLLNRIASDNYVIDREYITGHPKYLELYATAIYEIESNKIKRIWFIKE